MRRWTLAMCLLTGCDATASWAGDWSGMIMGHAQISGTWERTPYCEGELEGTIDSEGFFDFSGTCTVLWVTDEGEVLDAEVTGFVQDVTYVLSMKLDDPDDRLEFDDAAGTGNMADPLLAEADTSFFEDGGDEKSAFIALEIAR